MSGCDKPGVGVGKSGCFWYSFEMKTDLKQLADLAKLELSAEKLDALQSDLENIIKLVDEIQELDVSYESKADNIYNVYREDADNENDLCESRELIKSAPHNDGKHIMVTKVIDQ